ncbi:MAG: alpha-amylase, partial [Verrucomicrobia bacterium]|nr:alpha-amylase [Cytophagales bacterium]
QMLNGERSTKDIFQIQNRLAGINHNMLHFLENHDEQRLASKFFAGDMWKGAPAMVISATIDKGPVMIFFGQEVGEPGNGAEGFSGDDGRTTHFDYWGVPAHQQWMNEGKFDGGKLNPAQKNLRNFYQKLLNVCLRNEAIRQGHFFDLQYFNKKNYDTDKVFAFLRYTDKQKLLVIVNFDTKVKEVKVMIPEKTLEELSLSASASTELKDLLSEKSLNFKSESGANLRLEALQSYIFEFKN